MPQRPGQHLLQDIRRGAESAATVLMRLYIPTHSDASAITPARQDNTQRARLQQAAHPTTIAGRARRRLGRRIGVNQNDLVFLGHVADTLYSRALKR